MSSRGVVMLSLNLSTSREHGLTLENGLYITRIGPGSVAAREGTLAVGDRILSVLCPFRTPALHNLRTSTRSSVLLSACLFI